MVDVLRAALHKGDMPLSKLGAELVCGMEGAQEWMREAKIEQAAGVHGHEISCP